MVGGPKQLASTDRTLNASIFHKDMALMKIHHPIWIKCGKLYDGNWPLRQYSMMAVSTEE